VAAAVLPDSGLLTSCWPFVHTPPMDAPKLVSGLRKDQTSRRDLLTGIAAFGAGALIPWAKSAAQRSGDSVRRIDVHHHFTHPPNTWLLRPHIRELVDLAGAVGAGVAPAGEARAWAPRCPTGNSKKI